MADTKITGLTENTAPILTDIMPMVDDPGGSAATQKVTMTNLLGLLSAGMPPGGRLTLTTATPVTTADVNGAATVYYTPYIHDNIRLYDGTSWRTVSFVEKSITMVGATASKPYDIWGYLSAGTLALEKLIWTDGANRATALAYQNGRLVKSGDATRLYLGTVYCNASGGQTDDSLLKRFVWNYYNRIDRRAYVEDANSHNYTTGAWRSWNNNAALRVEFITGVLENPIGVSLNAQIETSYAGAAIDATNTASFSAATAYNANAGVVRAGGRDLYYPAIGYHYIQITEYGLAGATEESAYLNVDIWG